MTSGNVARTCRICGKSYIDWELSKARICGKCEDEVLDWIKENREKLFKIIFSGDMGD